MSENQHIIPLAEAEAMTHAYQQDPQFQGLTKACLIDAGAYNDVMNQPGCTGIRTYFAKNSEGKLTIVVVGVDAAGEDMTDGVLLNLANGCPTYCPQNSSLML